MRVRNKSTVVVESYFPADSSIVSRTHTKQINEMKKKALKETYLELIITKLHENAKYVAKYGKRLLYLMKSIGSTLLAFNRVWHLVLCLQC